MDTSVTESVMNVSETKSETEYRVSCSDPVRPSVDPKQGASSELVFSRQADCTFCTNSTVLYTKKLVYGFLWDPPFRRPLGVLHASYGTHVHIEQTSRDS